MSGAKRNMDPLTHLNEELMVHIFSFVGGRLHKGDTSRPETQGKAQLKKGEKKEEYVEEEVTDDEAEKVMKKKKTSDDDEEVYLDALEAGRFYFSLARVSKDWKRIMDRSIFHLASNILLSGWNFNGASWTGCMAWVQARKLSIGNILWDRDSHFCNFINPSTKVPNLLKLLRECHTVNVKTMNILVFLGHGMFEDLIPSRTFLDEIAAHCPNLQKAEVTFRCMGIEEGMGMTSEDLMWISPAFFSLKSLDGMKLTLNVPPPLEVDPMIITQMVEDLPNLECLFVNSEGQTTLGGNTGSVFSIRSKSLKQLLVENFTKHIKLSLDLPKLEVFRCKGFVGQPPQPGQPPQQIALMQQVVESDNVPEACLALVIHVCNPNGPPVGFPFRQLLRPNVMLLPLRAHHG